MTFFQRPGKNTLFLTARFKTKKRLNAVRHKMARKMLIGRVQEGIKKRQYFPIGGKIHE
jgi:hypothetical protein